MAAREQSLIQPDGNTVDLTLNSRNEASPMPERFPA